MSTQLLCTGQTPNTALLRELLPDSIVPEGAGKGMARVSRTMQVIVPRTAKKDSDAAKQLQGQLARLSIPEDPILTGSALPDESEVPYPHLFAVGDAADAFGAIKAGHTAHFQVSSGGLGGEKTFVVFTSVCV
jgi:apoptosis-inducing factor 2